MWKIKVINIRFGYIAMPSTTTWTFYV